MFFIGGGAIAVVVCGGIISFFAYIAAVGPETSVYTSNRIPSRFLRTIESIGALDKDEKIQFFYSDALTDIRDGFYFVSNKKVVLYSQTTDSPLTKISFKDIMDVDMIRDESFFEDSEITLYLHDGQVHSFPVSSEHDRDKQFLNAIKNQSINASESQ